MLRTSKLIFILIMGTIAPIIAQTKQAGPIIEDYGKVWRIESPDFKVEKEKEFKVVFDITKSPEAPAELNRSIETAARFLNMHAQSGVPAENLKVALVVHNKAFKDIINHEGYQKRFQVNNPNSELLKALMAVGTEVILCGQSAHSRGIEPGETMDGVQLSLSAMTALIQLQNDGYRLIKL